MAVTSADSVLAAAPAKRRLDWRKPAVLTGSLVPFAWLAYRALSGKLGANPIATAQNQLGLLALVFLMACLCCTPLKVLFGWTFPLRLRKTLGLFAFFTALLHFLVYLALDQVLMLGNVLRDVAKRPFIAVGFIALVLLVPLALTSTKRAVQRLGFRRWKALHRLVYVVGILACLHFFLRVKADVSEPLVYAALLATLLAVRGYDAAKQRLRKRRS